MSVSLLPSSDSKTHTKMCYLVVSYSPSCHCGIRDADVESPRQGSEWRASLGKGTKELVQRDFHFHGDGRPCGGAHGLDRSRGNDSFACALHYVVILVILWRIWVP